MASVKIRKIVPSLVQTPREIFWSVYVEFEKPPARSMDKQHRASIKNEPEPPLEPQQQEVYERLRLWRNQKAAAEGVSPYMILHNSHLQQMARNGVASVEEIARIRGVGTRKATKYGPDVLGIMAE